MHENLGNMKESEKQVLLDNTCFVFGEVAAYVWMTAQQTVSPPIQDKVPVFNFCILN